MDVINSILGPTEEKQADQIVDKVTDDGLSLKAASEEMAAGSQDPEKLEMKAAESIVDDVFGKAIDRKYDDEAEKKGLRNTLRNLIRSPETFDQQQELIADIDEALRNGEINEESAERAKRFAKRGDFRRAAIALRGQSSIIDKLVDKIGRKAEMDQKSPEKVRDEAAAEVADAYNISTGELFEILQDETGETEEELDQNMGDDTDQKQDNGESNPLDVIDDDVQSDLESLAEELDMSAEDLAGQLGLLPDGAGGGEPEPDQNQEEEEDIDQMADVEERIDQKLEDFKNELMGDEEEEGLIHRLAADAMQDEEVVENFLGTAEKKLDTTNTTPGPTVESSSGESTLGEVMFGGEN